MIDLNTFELYRYNGYNKDHRYISALLGNDQSVRNYISSDIDRIIYNVKERGERFDTTGYVDWYVAYLKRKNSSIPVGMIALDINENQTYMIDYAILPEFRNQNIGLLLLQQFSYYLLDEVGLEEIRGCINPANVASIKVAEQVGFKKEGITSYSIKGRK